MMAWELAEVEPEPQGDVLERSAEGIKRWGARQGVNLATRAAGLPGDVLSLANEFIAKPVAESLTGKPGLPYEQTFIGKALPTTETQRQNIRKGSYGEYLSPQTGTEKLFDDIVEDAAMIVNPTQVAKTGVNWAVRGMKALAKSVGANFLGETAKQVSGSESAGTATKIGSLFLMSLLDQKSAAKQIGDLYKKAEANLPSGAMTSSVKLEKNLSNLKSSVTKGRPIDNLAPSEKFVVDAIDKVERLAQDGKISVEQMVAQKRSLNEELSKLYQTVPGKKDQVRAKALAKNVNHYISNAIEDYGKTNPNFVVPYREADQAFGTIAKSNFLSRAVDKYIRHSPVTAGLLHLFGGPIGASVGGAVVPYQMIKLSFRIAKSPTLAKIYGNTMKAALKEDAVAFNKYLNELDDAIQEEEGKDYWEFIDQGSSNGSSGFEEEIQP